MCDTLGTLKQALSRYAEGFDAALLAAGQVGEALAAAVAIERVAAHLKTLAAARAAETRAWKGAGQRSAAHHLAQLSGTSVVEAADAIQTARRLERLPAVAAAARAGALSTRQVSMVADAAAVDPAAQGRLVQRAQGVSLAELGHECARTKAAATPDLEARRRSIHDRRFLRAYTGTDGAWNLHVRDNPEVGARVMAALSPLRDRLFAAARASGRQEPSEAFAADALVEAVCGPPEEGRRRPVGAASASSTKVIARVDLAALLRGRPLGEEVCELAGYGPVAVSAIRDLIDTGDPFLAAVVADGERVVGVSHLGRRPNAAQQTALQWLYPTCAVQGCSATTQLEADHRHDWARTHFTAFDLLDRLCHQHHQRKTLEGWSLVEGRGKRAFVPPGDPRHPATPKARAPA